MDPFSKRGNPIAQIGKLHPTLRNLCDEYLLARSEGLRAWRRILARACHAIGTDRFARYWTSGSDQLGLIQPSGFGRPTDPRCPRRFPEWRKIGPVHRPWRPVTLEIFGPTKGGPGKGQKVQRAEFREPWTGNMHILHTLHPINAIAKEATDPTKPKPHPSCRQPRNRQGLPQIRLRP